MMPGIAPAVEVWSEYNEQGLHLYSQWLNDGHQLVATAGTHIHRPPRKDITGAATNVVYVDELSEKALPLPENARWALVKIRDGFHQLRLARILYL